MQRPSHFHLRAGTWRTILFLSAIAFVSGCGDDGIAPEIEKGMPGITRVAVTASDYLVEVGSTVEMTAVVDADSGVQYTVGWELAGGTSAATIDASTGVLTTVARGYASPRACATAHLPGGQSQTVCGASTIGVVPDGAAGPELAFMREGTVFVSRLDGSAPVPVVPEADRPAWSPDGTRIAFTRRQAHTWQVCVAWEDGTEVRCVTSARDYGYVIGTPSWSSDGVKVALSVAEDGRSRLLVLNALGMEVDTVSTPPLGSVSWSPDGRKIAFATGAGLGIMNPDGSERVILAGTFDSYSVSDVAWSPDGGRLALELWACTDDWWYCDAAIGIVHADGTDLKVLAKSDLSSWVDTPTWSPDGTLVAYTLTRFYSCGHDPYPSCGSDIMVTGADGAATDVLLANGQSPSWRQ